MFKLKYFTKHNTFLNIIIATLTSFFSSSIIISITIIINQNYNLNLPPIIASLGALSVLVNSEFDGPLSKLKNCIFGNIISGLIGVSIKLIFDKIKSNNINLIWIKSSLSLSLSIFFMNIFDIVNPPGGATALIAVLGGDNIYKLKYYYVLLYLICTIIMIFIAKIINKLPKFVKIFRKNKKIKLEKELKILNKRIKEIQNILYNKEY